eukprot:TRINITY_DN10213_c0_g3_i1.p1 TRINITY_DN10213_c0_g3~~TRINITY_DN10213_c0_g3_i1.p1  ORF type:complete len:289 (+),score=55.36 TRINITY_DN10213_c0_g3_i1:134-1000(+)
MEGIDSELPLPELEPLLDQVGPYFDLCKRGEVPLLNVAVNHDHMDAAKWLLEHGANPNIVSRNGKSCLTYAIRNNNPAMFELLLQNGTDPHIMHLVQEGHKKDIRGSQLATYRGRTAFKLIILMLKSNPFEHRRRFYELLIHHGADVNIRNEQLSTPVFGPCAHNLPDDFDYLVLHGADPTPKCKHGRNILFGGEVPPAFRVHMQAVHDAFVEGGTPAVRELLIVMNVSAVATIMNAGDGASQPCSFDSAGCDIETGAEKVALAATTTDLNLDGQGDVANSKTPPLSG